MEEAKLNYTEFFDKFKFVQHDDYGGQCAVKLTVAPYEGFIVLIGRRISVVNPNTDKEGLQFDYEIVEAPPDVPIDVREFEDLLGGILLAILEDKFAQAEAQEAAEAAAQSEEQELGIKSVEFDPTTKATTIHFETPE